MRTNLMRSVVDQLQKEQTRLEDQLRGVSAALAAFGKVFLTGRLPRRSVTGKKRTMSVAARKRIAAAQRARWAKVKAGKVKKH